MRKEELFLFDPHHRHSIRLKNFDYSLPGTYFVTINVFRRERLFGNVVGEKIYLNVFGQIVQICWDNLIKHYANIVLDSFVIMPNHFHAVIIIKGAMLNTNHVRAGLKPAPTKDHPLSEIVRAFKTFSARKINELRKSPGLPVWQRNYFERVIRNDEELNEIREYINNNVTVWNKDAENPKTIDM